jgi:hypothetical protein
MATPNATVGARRVFANLKYIYMTPWQFTEGEDGSIVESLGDTTYDIVDVVADTTTVEQAENDINALDHEFSGTPLFENINLGEKTFSCESIDLQNEILGAMFGWIVDGDAVYAPTAYKDLYVAIEMGFNSTDDIVVLPKVKLNSRAVIASMKTDASRANINGTCYEAYIGKNKTDMAILKGGTEYKIGATEQK